MTTRYARRTGTLFAGLALMMTLLMASAAQAQVLYGSIVGNVTDKSDAAITGATVKITNKATNQSREAATNADGSFTFTTVQTGVWEISVSKNGFKTLTRSKVEVTLNIRV